MRQHNTNINGKAFKHKEVMSVWEKAQPIKEAPTLLGSDIRADAFGNEIHFDQYANTNSQYGWEIDHIKPVSKGGTDTLSNLQPLHWKENRSKSDKYP